MLNGTMAHAVEMDDVYKLGKVHSGAVVVPAVLGFGELNNSSGKEANLSHSGGLRSDEPDWYSD